MSDIQRLAVTPLEAARMLGCGRTKIFELMKTEQIQRIKLGKKTLIRVEDLKSFINSFS